MKGSARWVKPAIAVKPCAEWHRGSCAFSGKALIDIIHHALEIVRGQIKFDDLAVGSIIMNNRAAEANYMQNALSWEQ